MIFERYKTNFDEFFNKPSQALIDYTTDNKSAATSLRAMLRSSHSTRQGRHQGMTITRNPLGGMSISYPNGKPSLPTNVWNIPDFPYSTTSDDHLFRIEFNKLFNKLHPYSIPQKLRSEAYVIQHKETKTVYNMLVNVFLDTGKPTEKIKRLIEDELIPGMIDDKDSHYDILGFTDCAYTPRSWLKKENYGNCIRLGDQFLKFFDEEDSQYYVPEIIIGCESLKTLCDDDVHNIHLEHNLSHTDFWRRRNKMDNMAYKLSYRQRQLLEYACREK